MNTNGAVPGSYRIGIANQANVGTHYPLDCSVNADYFVVTRYNSYNGETTLWVNPRESLSQVIATDASQTPFVGAYGLRREWRHRQSSDQQSGRKHLLPESSSIGADPVITKISVSGAAVTVDFDAGDSDSATEFD